MASSEKLIFVFGSNLNGSHGGGAAHHAYLTCGAQYGKAFGLQGESFAIPTMGFLFEPLPLDMIGYFFLQFLDFAEKNKDLTFTLTPIGTGIAGYTPEEICTVIPFKSLPDNIILPKEFIENANSNTTE